MGTYYTAAGKEVVDGDIAYASDLNTINSAVESGFNQVESAMTAIAANSDYYMLKSQEWAEKPVDTQVEAGKYSALHWASKSQGYSTAASTSATNASNSATAASTSATNASNSATAASTSATNANTYASNASASATSANTYAGNASTSATNASNSATAASTSATNASNSATAAANSATLAATYGAPVGAIVPYIGGYFTSSSNTGFTNVLGNSISTVNTLYNSIGWYVCDGSVLNLASSTIFNGTNRYLPNLTDSRFILGSTSAGATGGSNSVAHTHDISHSHTTGDFTLTTNEMPSHAHAYSAYYNLDGYGGAGDYTPQIGYWETTSYTGNGASHNHGSTSTLWSNSGAASNTENRPLFLACIYLMKVK